MKNINILENDELFFNDITSKLDVVFNEIKTESKDKNLYKINEASSLTCREGLIGGRE